MPDPIKMDDLLLQIASTRGYLMWGTVDKAYKMLDELEKAMFSLAVYVQQLNEALDRMQEEVNDHERKLNASTDE